MVPHAWNSPKVALLVGLRIRDRAAGQFRDRLPNIAQPPMYSAPNRLEVLVTGPEVL